MNKNKRFIMVNSAVVRKIAQTMGVTTRTVHYALSYTNNSALCRRIRKMAIENGGKVYIEADTTTNIEL